MYILFQRSRIKNSMFTCTPMIVLFCYTSYTPVHVHMHQWLLLFQDYSGAHYLVFKQHTLRLPATVTVTPCGFIITLSEKLGVFDTTAALKEVHHISEIRDVS